MAYITSSLTSANPSADLYTAMATALTTAGYTLADTVVISTRTHKIWKSAAANNTAGLDWYVDLAYPTTGTGNLSIMPMEFFDPATDLAYRMVYAGANNATIETTYYSRWGATGQTLESANWPLNASYSVSNGIQVQTSTSAFGYWISITGDRILVLTSVTPTIVGYYGLFTPYSEYATKAGAALYPLVMAALDTNVSMVTGTTPGAVMVGFTRMPRATTIAWHTAGRILPLYGPTYLASLPAGPFNYAAGPQLSPFSVHPVSNSAGGYLGTLKDVGCSASSGVARGDTMIVGSDTWIAGSTAANNVSIALRAV